MERSRKARVQEALEFFAWLAGDGPHTLIPDEYWVGAHQLLSRTLGGSVRGHEAPDADRESRGVGVLTWEADSFASEETEEASKCRSE